MPARDHPDHTADIRRQLADQAIYGVCGLFVAASAAGMLALLERIVGNPLPALGLMWIVNAGLVGVSLLYLAITAVRWLVYLRRRAELDARGAEIVGGFEARIATRRRHDSP